MISRATVSFCGVDRTYPGAPPVHALRGVSFRIGAGDFWAIEGPSGSGKTTLLAIAGGLDRPTRGRVSLCGQDLTEVSARGLPAFRRERVGFVFQDFKLIDLLTAEENVALPLELRGMRRVRVRARAMLDRLGIAERARTWARDLSGGEKQRIAIARALVGDPGVLLADEPTAHLDGPTAEEIVRLLGDLAVERGTTVLIVSHDPRVTRHADRTLRLVDGCLDPPLRKEEIA